VFGTTIAGGLDEGDPMPPEPARKPQPAGAPAAPPADPRARRWSLILAAALAAVYLVGTWLSAGARGFDDVDYTAFYAELEKGNVESLTLRGRSARGTFREGVTVRGKSLRDFRTQLPAQEDPQLLPALRQQKVAVAVEEESSSFGELLALFGPWILVVVVWWWLSRQRRALGPGGAIGSALRSHAKRYERSTLTATFDDVAGLGPAKRDLQEVVDYLKEPERYRRMGGKMPRGVLVVGAPGTGKTLLARAVAGEAGVPFFSISGSEFIELFVGVGAARVRELFHDAKKAAPSIVFIDEIDAVGRSRGTGLGGGHDEREQTLNQLLAEMDGFDRADQVVVMAATNRPDVLDPALLRPGRFDRRVVVDLPECAARRAILEVHVRDKPIAAEVSLDDIARATPGFSGADLANLVNEAALAAVRRGAERIEPRDFAGAQDKIELGDPRETLLAPEEKRRTAVHEAGHAVVAHYSEGAEPLRRVSILPRGLALGATQQTTSGDRHLMTQRDLRTKLRVLLGGHAAERLELGETSSGSENDLRVATRLAQQMVARLGMSERLGPMYHEHQAEHPFLGARIATNGGTSDRTIHEIELEARRLLSEASSDATATLRAHRDALARLTDALLERETLETDELRGVLDGPDSEVKPRRAGAARCEAPPDRP
jgi:cell division protease FtsH